MSSEIWVLSNLNFITLKLYRGLCVCIYVCIYLHTEICMWIHTFTSDIMYPHARIDANTHTYNYNAWLLLRIINTGYWYKIPAFIKFTQTFTHLLIQQPIYLTNIYKLFVQPLGSLMDFKMIKTKAYPKRGSNALKERGQFTTNDYECENN